MENTLENMTLNEIYREEHRLFEELAARYGNFTEERNFLLDRYCQVMEQRRIKQAEQYKSDEKLKYINLQPCGLCFTEGEFTGLSRKDNETFLCPTCEMREAMNEYRNNPGAV